MTGKRKEQALQVETDLLATVFESSPNILMLVNAEGRVEKINRAGSEFANSPQEELIGLLGGEVFRCIDSFNGKGCGRNPDCGDCPVRTRMTRSLNKGETILNEEGRLTVQKDAQVIPLDFLISTVPVTVAGENKTLITIVDITEQKRADEHMRHQAYLLENVSDAIISTDADFVIQSWNRAAEEVYGWKEEEVLGKVVDDVLKSEFLEPLTQILDEFYKERSWRGEAIQYRKDGTPISILSSVRLIQDDKGNLIRAIATNRDITERKQAEEALQRSELQYRTILRTATDGFWLVDPHNGKIMDVNDAYCQMSSYTRDEILQMTVADFEAIESADEVHAHAQRVQLLGGDRFETLHRRKDGSLFQVEVSIQTLKGDGDRNFAFIRDITARKEVEQALRKSEEQYRLLFDEMLSGFALHEIICNETGKPVDYRFLAVNSVFEELTGLKANDLIGKTVLEVLPDTESFWIERYGRVALEGITDQFDGYSGSIGKYYEARAFCPEPGKFAVMFHDVTERKQVEDDLQIALTKYQTLFNTMPLGITVSDAAGNILETNAMAEKLLDLPQVEHNRRSIDDPEWHIVRPDGTPMPADEYASVRALKEKRLTENVEMGIVKSEGEIMWLSVTADLLPLDGYGVVIAYSEITERKHTEERLKRLLQEKEILLAEVHHRVKNNLQIVTSLLGLQAREIKDERFRMAFEESRNRINSMALVHEQLYRAREYAQIEFSEYVDQLASTLFSMYHVESKKIELQIDAKDLHLDLEKAIPCGLLLNELITNSLKYAFPNDRRGNLWIRLTQKKHRMILTVGDDGVGIPVGFDLKDSQSLGLQLVNLLAEHDLQGNITLDRKVGTQYRIEFPAKIRNEG